jgi:hydrogenase large subunit
MRQEAIELMAIDNQQQQQASALSDELMQLIRKKNAESLNQPTDPLSRLEGGLAVHCRVDLTHKKILEAASMATLFRGYEALLPGRDLKQVGLVSATASGICGGVHATASALCLEMALGLRPPPFGIVLRNLLLSCQYLNDNCMHLFVLAGPDYSQQIVEQTNPEIWQKAQQASCRFANIHGHTKISDLMQALNKGDGSLYREALQMVSLARQAYSLLGGKYPHSESIIPGGVTITANQESLAQFTQLLEPFLTYSQKAAAIWDDIFDFMLDANPAYENLGRNSVSLLDFGQWDHPDYYDGRYEHCDLWGQKRWSTPAAIINGKLACTQLSKLNAGMEEFLDYSYQLRSNVPAENIVHADPLGNPISLFHPWNKRTHPPKSLNPQAYSWGSSLTWQGHNFEVGAYARLYLTAVAQKSPLNYYFFASGKGIDFLLPRANGQEINLSWRIPSIWNTFERNRARAYTLAFNVAVTQENIRIAKQLITQGETQTHTDIAHHKGGQQLGVGLWGASRGFLAHWAVLKDQVIDNYQITIPSRVNVGTCTPTREPGPLESALLNTPLLESKFKDENDFFGIDIQRTIQSFDPCMTCSARLLINNSDQVLERVIDTSLKLPG